MIKDENRWRNLMQTQSMCDIGEYVYDIAFNELPSWKVLFDKRIVYFYALTQDSKNWINVHGWCPVSNSIVSIKTFQYNIIENSKVHQDPIIKDKIFDSWHMTSEFLLYKLYEISDTVLYAKMFEDSAPFILQK